MQDPQNIRIDNYDYPLTDDRIAKFPLAQRDLSKLLIYKKGEISETIFKNLPEMLSSDTLLICNNTRVIQARLHFRKPTGALIEIFCLEPIYPNDYLMSFQSTESCRWSCMVGNLSKWKHGILHRTLSIDDKEVTISVERGMAIGANAHEITFSWNNPGVTFASLLEAIGELPIPPYLNRQTEESDKTTYQTVYSSIEGSVAAPTAGLHFTPEVFSDLENLSIPCRELTLHVGAGTFKPVKSETIGEHEMHTEYISVSCDLIKELATTPRQVIAVGTTSVRTLESLYYIGKTLYCNPEATTDDLIVKQWQPYDGTKEISVQESFLSIVKYLEHNNIDRLISATRIIIVPGYKFHIVKGLVTNFHQPHSTLLLLVSALIGEKWRDIYNYALSNDFRFLSYGDSSLLIP